MAPDGNSRDSWRDECQMVMTFVMPLGGSLRNELWWPFTSVSALHLRVGLAPCRPLKSACPHTRPWWFVMQEQGKRPVTHGPGSPYSRQIRSSSGGWAQKQWGDALCIFRRCLQQRCSHGVLSLRTVIVVLSTWRPMRPNASPSTWAKGAADGVPDGIGSR